MLHKIYNQCKEQLISKASREFSDERVLPSLGLKMTLTPVPSYVNSTCYALLFLVLYRIMNSFRPPCGREASIGPMMYEDLDSNAIKYGQQANNREDARFVLGTSKQNNLS